MRRGSARAVTFVRLSASINTAGIPSDAAELIPPTVSRRYATLLRRYK